MQQDNIQAETHTSPRTREESENFAQRRAAIADKAFADILARVEDLVNMQGETGASVRELADGVAQVARHTMPPSKDELKNMNVFSRTVHKIDGVLSKAGPYLRAGAAIVATGGAVYGGVKGAQATYRWATKPKSDAKAMPVGEPISVG